MTLKIIGGLLRGRILKTPPHAKTRPTTALLREALFNICAEWIPKARFLDLFAGSGAIGFEAISRGAAFTTFVEHDRQAVQCIRENASLLQLEPNVQILNLDAHNAIIRLTSPYDLIYADPPYDCDPTEIFRLIIHHALLAPQGLLFLEKRYDATSSLPTNIHSSLTLVKSRRYGIAHLHQFRYSVLIPIAESAARKHPEIGPPS